jgi:DNA-binding LacI/PurR family transcriptional regulator
VARAAKVSIGTVSSVINDGSAVAPETRRRVLGLIAELGYEPNNAARTLKRGRISSIGIIVPDLQNPYFASVAEGIERAAAKNDVLMVLCLTSAESEREEYFVKLLRNRRLDGVIYLSGTGLPSAALLKLSERGNMVFVDERLPGIDVPFVSADNRVGARVLARHVIAAGHRRLAIIGGPPRLWTSEQRLAGYREAIAAAGLDPDAVPVSEGDYSERSGHAAAARLLAQPPSDRPTAVICANDLMAMGALRACREIGLAVPKDISIVGFDDIPATGLLDPPLTTVAQPGREMGAAAADLLLHRIGARPDPPARVEFPTVFVQRASVAPPRRHGNRV